MAFSYCIQFFPILHHMMNGRGGGAGGGGERRVGGKRGVRWR